jgi:1-aminocyclopropane-1-carboxylate deaminase/D-cysteine desulfhydrase-like pyridoxal-dependent ACC family enzyme
MSIDAVLAALHSIPRVALASYPSPVEEMTRLRAALGGGPRLLVKRDDALGFAFGGNKVRKAEYVAARAQADGADTLVTTGGVQSNHARVTAAAAAKLGMRCVIVVNGVKPERATANALLDALLGAEVVYVPSRDDRAAALTATTERLRSEGRHPFEIPLGASIPLGAVAFVQAVAELVRQLPAPPDVIVHSTSSGGTQAGLVAGCRLLGLPTRVLGVSADASAPALERIVRDLVGGVEELLGAGRGTLAPPAIEIDDRFVGPGYGIATDESREAIALLARTEAIFLDPTYTSKAMAGLIAALRARRFPESQTVLFWHTGGQVGLFA